MSEETTHVNNALGNCVYPNISGLLKRPKPHAHLDPHLLRARVKTPTNRRPVVMPYIKGVSEQLTRTFKAYNTPAFFNPTNTLRQILVSPKDKTHKDQVCGPIYYIQYGDCEACYIGETDRSLKAQFLEHRRSSSSTSEVS